MKDIFLKFVTKGYKIHNKRVLGNPDYSSEETKLKDKTQEIALIVEWLRINYGIHVTHEWDYSYSSEREYYFYKIKFKDEENFIKVLTGESVTSPQEAYSAAFDYVLNNLI
jgi:hypothetical protein